MKRNRQIIVQCRVYPKRRSDFTKDEYVAVLRAFNTQRHKSVAEQIREELVDFDADNAHRALCEQRERSLFRPEIEGVKTLKIEGVKVRHVISDQKAQHVERIKQVVFQDRRRY